MRETPKSVPKGTLGTSKGTGPSPPIQPPVRIILESCKMLGVSALYRRDLTNATGSFGARVIFDFEAGFYDPNPLILGIEILPKQKAPIDLGHVCLTESIWKDWGKDKVKVDVKLETSSDGGPWEPSRGAGQIRQPEGCKSQVVSSPEIAAIFSVVVE